LPSLLSILVTYGMLLWSQRRQLQGTCVGGLDLEPLSPGGRMALAGIGITAIVLLVVSSLDIQLGIPTAILGVLTAIAVAWRARLSPSALARDVTWSVLPLVAGLFVLVETLDRTGVTRMLAQQLQRLTHYCDTGAAAVSGSVVAVASNLMNNLPAGLIASSTLAQAHSPPLVIDALLIGVDLGPNLSMTGSLATILWLAALRREGEQVTFLQFLRVGAWVMIPALAVALTARLFIG
jgi:arsenical pump membrane protein